MKKYVTNVDSLLPIALMLVLIVLIFRVLLIADVVLFSSDSNVGYNALVHANLPGIMLGFWSDSALLGFSAYLPVGTTYFLLWLLPPEFFTNWIYACYILGASLVFMGFLRRTGLGVQASCISALIAFWLSSNFTLSYAGHLGKFGVLFFATVFLWTMGRLPAMERRFSGAVLAGGAMGMMIVEQADVGLFFALILGPYALFVMYCKCKLRGWMFVKLLAALLVPAFLIALRPALEGYRVNIQDVAAVSADDPTAQWDFVTQWSWPPEESIDFIAPGYTGWRSGEPAGPYWGRMGRSAEWEPSQRRGFQNFKLENVYMGAIPVALAVFAMLAAALALRRRDQVARFLPDEICIPEVWFWSAVAILTLLLAFGKNFPLYSIFYQLPLVGNIRNPNKFLQIFQLAVAILAAYGLDILLVSRRVKI